MIESLDSEMFLPLTEDDAEAAIAGTKGNDATYDHSPSGGDLHTDFHTDF